MQAFGFQPLRHEYATFPFEFIEVCLRRLREFEISATRNIKLKPVISFPTPYERFPPVQEKASNARGMPGGNVEASI